MVLKFLNWGLTEKKDLMFKLTVLQRSMQIARGIFLFKMIISTPAKAEQCLNKCFQFAKSAHFDRQHFKMKRAEFASILTPKNVSLLIC